MKPPIVHRSARHGLTVLEVLIILVVVIVLAAIAIYALKSNKKIASQDVSLDALRQIMTGYSAYSTENNGQLLPGYPDIPHVQALGIKGTLPSGETLTILDTNPYCWRLAPYLNNAWQVLMADYRSDELIAAFTKEYSCGRYVCDPPQFAGVFGPGSAGIMEMGIAFHTSFGLNTMYVGGDSYHGDPELSPWDKWPEPNPRNIAATQLNQVKTPSRLLVFAATRAVNSEALGVKFKTDRQLGFHSLRAPLSDFDPQSQKAETSEWELDESGKVVFVGTTGVGIFVGLPVDRRHDGNVPLSHLDGSVMNERLENLGPKAGSDKAKFDMSRWSPFANPTK